MTRLVLIAALLVAGGAAADEPPVVDPDTEAAHRHFDRAIELYDQQLYRDALGELQAARDLRPLPALEYNIGRCYERLEEWGNAAAAYRRYLAVEKGSTEEVELSQRLSVLDERAKKAEEKRIADARPPAPPKPRFGRLGKAALAVGGVAILLGLGGGATRLAMYPVYSQKKSDCAARQCTDSDLTGLRALDGASIALFAVAGAAAVIDLVLWVIDRRHHREAAIVPPAAPSPATLGFAF